MQLRRLFRGRFLLAHIPQIAHLVSQVMRRNISLLAFNLTHCRCLLVAWLILTIFLSLVVFNLLPKLWDSRLLFILEGWLLIGKVASYVFDSSLGDIVDFVVWMVECWVVLVLLVRCWSEDWVAVRFILSNWFIWVVRWPSQTEI